MESSNRECQHLSTAAGFDVKERVRAATDIVDVIGRDLELRPQGRNFVARCPFHNDTKPSMTINPARQSWKCWVCDIGGDVFSFVMKREGLDFPSALRSLADAAGIEVPTFRRGPNTKPGEPNDRDTLLAAIDLVAKAYFAQLSDPQSEEARLALEYCNRRGIDDANREQFQIGFAPDSWDFAMNLLRRHHFSEAVAKACGVVVGRESGSGGYDRFRGRLMFPICDATGSVISLGGRVVPELVNKSNETSGNDEPQTGGAKYINGPETLLYRKSNELYGLHLAREAMRRDGEVFVMEGYTDVVAARMAGIEPVVAVLGTALTTDHVRVLKRFANRVVLVLDGDEAGRRRADEVLDVFVQADIDLRVMTLPDGVDPADYLKLHTASAFRELSQSSPDALQHKLNRLVDGVDVRTDTQSVTNAIESMLQVLCKAPTTSDKLMLKMDQMLVRMSAVFGLPVERLQRRLDAMRSERADRERRNRAYRRSARRHQPAASNRTNRDGIDQTFDQASAEDLSAYGVDDRTIAEYSETEHFDAPSTSPQAVPLTGIDRQLFETLLESPDVAAMAIESIDVAWLETSTAKMLLSAYQDLDLQARELTAESLLIILENEFLKNEIVSLLERIEQRSQEELDSPTDRYSAILARYHELAFEAEKQRQIDTLRSAQLPEDEELAVLQQLFAAERIRQTPR
ncbi:MAG: DNA primase [Planctomycetota bacterium]